MVLLNNPHLCVLCWIKLLQRLLETTTSRYATIWSIYVLQGSVL